MTSIVQPAETTRPDVPLPGATAVPHLRRPHVVAQGTSAGTVPVRRAPILQVEAVTALVGGTAAAFASGDGLLALLACAGWFALSYSGRAMSGARVRRSVYPLLRAAVIVLACAAGGVALAGAERGLDGVVLAVLTAFSVAALIRVGSTRLAGPARVLLVGGTATLDQHPLTRGTDPHVRVVGLVPVDASPGLHRSSSSAQLAELERCGWPERVAAPAVALGADLVAVLPDTPLDPTDVRRATWALEQSGVDLIVLGGFAGIDPHRLTPASVAGQVGLHVATPGRPVAVTRLRNAVDRSVAVLLLLLLAPALGLLALAVRAESRGNPFFTQTRVGLGGAPFRMYKLRTMVPGAEALKVTLECVNEADGHFFKIRRDPRLTRLGAWLRRTSLDELPQLVNVVRGEMSLIGPRPLLPREADALDDSARRRLGVRPGMTGLWQVSGRCELGWDESMRLDTHYVDNWTLSTDLLIAARTVSAVVGGRGAC